MIPFTFITVLLLLIISVPRPIITDNDLADIERTVPQIIESRGFVCESHTVVTADGYILTIHRVVNPLYRKSNLKPVILQHGLAASSADFVAADSGGSVHLPPSAPVGGNQAFELSRRGYDVWLPNSRGNRYSRRHAKLDPDKDAKYWEFSFDEKSRYDLPAVIDYILAKTRHRHVAFSAVSQGALIMFTLLASEPKYNAIIKPFIAIAPTVYAHHIKSAFRHLPRAWPLVELLKLRGGELFGTIPSPLRSLTGHCLKSSPLCRNLANRLIGYEGEKMNTGRANIYAHHVPAGTSAMNVLHFIQFYNSRKITRYDFGERENVRRYGRKEPPEYNLSAITNRYIILMSSPNDLLADQEDLKLLVTKLRVPVYEHYVVPDKKFDHFDFIWGKNAPKYVVTKLIRILDAFK